MASTTAAGAPAAADPQAIPSTDDTWKLAQKQRAAIHKELEHIQKGDPGTNEIARFEKVEKLMQNYRLACIETIWLDLRAANEKGAEDALWSTHTLVTKTYRKVLGRLQGNDHVVLKRKLEKLYSNYLKTAQYFYRGYLQRVCARHDTPDLKRIAHRAELEAMPLPEKDKVDTTAADLDNIVKQSCHKTLIYLGDLARYRTLLRTKDPKWEGALSYYLLANELIPESGYGHHQCGVICVENEDHLQVVYYLYRALACTLPHPNASTNLEREFRDLQKRKNITTKHALVTWFVKLHAFYSQGKEFPERKELESEVDHRLGLAMKTGTGYGSDLDLLKMVLINITAYVAAQDKISKKWTDEGSLSCQFILLLNLRTINAIARLLGEEIAGVIKRMGAETPAGASTPSPAEPTTKFTPALNRVLTLLRVYMAWLCSFGSQLVDFRAHLEPQFGTMCTTLSNTLTLLFELLGGDQQLGSTVSWRFPEDDITLGIDCLNGPNLHDGCQLYYDAFARKPKPRREEVASADKTEDDVTFTRALDVLLCALDLSMPESRFPFTTAAITKESRELTTFVYLERGKPEPTPNLPPVQHPAPAQHLTPTAVPATLQQTPMKPEAVLSPCESNELSEDQDFYGPNLRNTATDGGPRGVQVPAPVVPPPTVPVSEFPIERQMFNILNEFINPPESALSSKPKTPNHPPARTSPYGMDSAAVAEAFGAGASSSPAPGSAGAKRFPTLPWEYFYKPPTNPALRSDANAMAANWGTNGGGLSRPTSSGNATQFGVGAATGNPLARQAHQRYGSLGRSDPAEGQAEVLQSSESASSRAGQPQQAYSTRGGWHNAAAEGSAPSPLGTAPNLPQQSTWAPPVSPWQNANGQPPPATTGAAFNSPFSTFNFASTASSLPQVYSPWGVPAAVNRFPTAQSPSSPSRTSAAYTGGAIPSPSGGRYATDYSSAMASGHVSQNSFAGAWPDARQPRNGSVAQPPLGQVDIWGDPIRQQPTVGENTSGKSVMQRGMPKR